MDKHTEKIVLLHPLEPISPLVRVFFYLDSTVCPFYHQSYIFMPIKIRRDCYAIQGSAVFEEVLVYGLFKCMLGLYKKWKFHY